MIKEKCVHPEYAVVDGTCTLCHGCAHTQTAPAAARMRLRYGSAAAVVCQGCGAYQLQLTGANPWHQGPYETAVAEAEAMEDV